MKAVMGREKYLAFALAGLALLLAGSLLWEWTQGKSLERDLSKLRKIPVTAVPAQTILPEFNLPNQETGFPELLSRPIFSVSRRSFATAGQAGAMKKGQFVLVGVLITPKQRSALLRDVVSNKTEAVALVGVVRGLTLGEVEADRVVLRQGAESEELLLNVQTGPKLPVSPPAAPKPAAAPPEQPASAAAPASSPGSVRQREKYSTGRP